MPLRVLILCGFVAIAAAIFSPSAEAQARCGDPGAAGNQACLAEAARLKSSGDIVGAGRTFTGACLIYGDGEACLEAVTLTRGKADQRQVYLDALRGGCKLELYAYCGEGFQAVSKADKPGYDYALADEFAAGGCLAKSSNMCYSWGRLHDDRRPYKDAEIRLDKALVGYHRACENKYEDDAIKGDKLTWACWRAYEITSDTASKYADGKKAAAALVNGCQQDQAYFCALGSWAFYRGADGISKNIDYALASAEKGCQLGEAEQCKEASYYAHGELDNEKRAFPFYETLCTTHSEPEGCRLAAILNFYHGDKADQADLDQKSCEMAKDGWACYGVAMRALKTSKQYSFAESALKTSCASGYAPACDYIAERKRRLAKSAADYEAYRAERAAQLDAQRRAQSQRPAYTPKFTYSGGGGFGTSGSSFKPSYQQCVGNSYLSGCSRFD